MLPRTNFTEIYTYIVCPSKLYLKLTGYGGEVERTYTPPSISPAILGKQGERTVSEGYLREPQLRVPEVKRREVSYPKADLNKFIKTMTKVARNNTEAILYECKRITAGYRPVSVTEVAKSLKKKFGIAAIIQNVDYTTIPHHYVGRIDFLGIKEDKEVVVLEVKNKNQKPDKRDFLQLEYYMAGLPKQYQFTKIHEHVNELVAQLYPQKYLSYLTHMKRLDLMKEERSNISDILLGGMETLRDEDRNIFLKRYYSKDLSKSLAQDEEDQESTTGQSLDLTESYSLWGNDIEQQGKELVAVEGFLRTVPEYADLSTEIRKLTEKVLITRKDFDDAADLVADFMSKGIKNGLLIDARREEIHDTPLTTDFDSIAKDIWSVKKNALMRTPICAKNTTSCAYCNYRKACAKVITEGELEPVTSITSIAHKGFSALKYEYEPPSEYRVPLDEDTGTSHFPAKVRFYAGRASRSRELSDKELLKSVLSKSEWGYKSWFAGKQGWRSLFIDAIVSKKLKLEFDFWRI